MQFYHGTSSRAWAAIQRDGFLRPGSCCRGSNEGAQLYLTDWPPYALMFSVMRARDSRTKPVLLAVDVEEESLGTPDDGLPGEWYTITAIPVSRVRQIQIPIDMLREVRRNNPPFRLGPPVVVPDRIDKFEGATW
jgi:hypothetical protein